jgi:hypothetical protein
MKGLLDLHEIAAFRALDANNHIIGRQDQGDLTKNARGLSGTPAFCMDSGIAVAKKLFVCE